ncbi:DUF3077 domain-containing protein [Pseudomonas sp. B21-012]|uniref:DUF6124 family protein n=1 Tax=Pseudomonas TaxID=286 RepID=UPI00029AC424|nr:MULTISPECIES: DUF3077 domain-containing protein [Pseudomonas]UVM20693.1 DUF3077 domain-containing protein [Pseudomonas wadenswilerensis]UVM54679.1 DUF3077 domain-containing protein [Pseudomonas sp. B21-012]SPO65644.1 conserved protein of unknown function [Pseudomonas sp. JV241A]
MKKIVPDPPSLDLTETTTASTSFGTNRMFSVREGIPAEEALLHAGQLLRCAEATVSDALDHLTLNDRSIVAGAGQHIETARALIDAVIDGGGVQRIFSD